MADPVSPSNPIDELDREARSIAVKLAHHGIDLSRLLTRLVDALRYLERHPRDDHRQG